MIFVCQRTDVVMVKKEASVFLGDDDCRCMTTVGLTGVSRGGGRIEYGLDQTAPG